MKKFLKLLAAMSFCLVVFASCEDETMEDVSTMIEQATDEEDEKKQKPGGN